MSNANPIHDAPLYDLGMEPHLSRPDQLEVIAWTKPALDLIHNLYGLEVGSRIQIAKTDREGFVSLAEASNLKVEIRIMPKGFRYYLRAHGVYQAPAINVTEAYSLAHNLANGHLEPIAIYIREMGRPDSDDRLLAIVQPDTQGAH